jgi:hypothetical protein
MEHVWPSVSRKNPAFLHILAKSERYKPRYDAAKQQVPRVEVPDVGKVYRVTNYHTGDFVATCVEKLFQTARYRVNAPLGVCRE